MLTRPSPSLSTWDVVICHRLLEEVDALFVPSIHQVDVFVRTPLESPTLEISIATASRLPVVSDLKRAVIKALDLKRDPKKARDIHVTLRVYANVFHHHVINPTT
jgi:hypothetical protein